MGEQCKICPVECNADRKNGVGYCGQSDKMKIAKYYLHTYEEPPISGTNGSGTVFFCGCSLKCVFCQNYELSRSKTGKEITPSELAEIFKELEKMGAHNINLVTGSHFVNQIVEAFKIYRPKVPVVYNTHAYEKVETLEIINPYVDVYLPDLKFFSPELSKRYTGKSDYFKVASKAIKFMLNAKKTVLGDDGLLKQGVIVRHMIMPLGVKDSKQILSWFAQNNQNGAYLSLMGQYTPFGDNQNFPELKRPITKKEYDRVYEHLLSLGISEYFIQELGSASESFIPKWDF
ncbi:MAG: radical SAM protein [Clostridia bacterium]|nr:radical SAM protein [Clostridia bacterium]